MNEFKKEIFLGITNKGKIAFANIKFKHPVFYGNGRKNIKENEIEFTASFDISDIFNKTEYINSGRYEEDITDYVDSLSKEEKYDLCEKFNCTPDNLAEEYFQMIEESGGPGYFLDNSSFPEECTVNNNDYIFLSSSSGRIDLREEGMKINLDEDLYNKINNYWDKYHLKEISEDKAKSLINSIETSIKENKAIDGDDLNNIDNFLGRYINNNIEHTANQNNDEEEEL